MAKLYAPLVAAIGLLGCSAPKKMLKPVHIVAPSYPRELHVQSITGEVRVTATIDAYGNVSEAHGSGEPNLAWYATENLRLWRFERPPHFPLEQTFHYEFQIQPDNGLGCGIPPSRAIIDLPDRVTVVAKPVHICDQIVH